MASKKINYLSRGFEDIKNELIKFSNRYYPELSDDFNDSSVGAWFIDLVSAVGDDLSYHIDRQYQETNIDSANLSSTVSNMARTNGLKIPSKKASVCEIELSCNLPMNNGGNAPNWNYAPIVQQTSIVSAGNYNFQLTEDVDFSDQFNKDGYSNRKIVPSRDSNGNITSYTVSKSTIVINGTSKIYRKVISSSDLKPFMEIVLPESDVMEVESIIFKETSDYSTYPSIYEYFIDSEEFRISKDAVMTYRFFECDSLADQWRFGTKAKIKKSNGIEYIDPYKPYEYQDYTEGGGTTSASTRTTRYYKGQWKPLKQKFITEFTDNGYMKIIFGAGNDQEIPSGSTYANYIMSKIANNDMLGILPKEGWTMFVLYRVGGGSETNIGPNAINKITLANIDWGGNTNNTNGTIRGNVINSLKVTNLSTALAGKDAPSTEEIKHLMKYNTSAQNRSVVVDDYKIKLSQMPPKYGTPFRSCVIETNNKIEIDVLGLNSEGQLDSTLPYSLITNIIEYMSHYKQINDYIEIKSGRIYNIGIMLDLFVDKNYNVANVVSNVIDTVNSYFDVSKHEMGEDIFVGDLEKEITLQDGVLSLISLKIYKVWNGGYSPDKCPLPTKTQGNVCGVTNEIEFTPKDPSASAEEIDLEAVDKVLYSDYNSMYSILNGNTDIQVRVKTR